MKRYSLDVKQAAERLGITPKKLYVMAERRQIAHLRTCGNLSERIVQGKRQTFTVSGRLKFAPEDCDAWTAAHGVDAAPVDDARQAPTPILEPLPMPAEKRFA